MENYKCSIDPLKVNTGDFEIGINKDMMNIDGFKLLEELCLLHDDTLISKEEKTEKLKRILNESMG